MKVFLHYEDTDNDELHKTSKITLPKKWISGPCDAVLKLFVDSYNKKFTETPLNLSNVHLETDAGDALANQSIVSDHFSDSCDIYIRHGTPPSLASVTAAKVPGAVAKEGVKEPVKEPAAAPAEATAESTNGAPKLLLCKRFGCQKKYDPAHNHDQACHYHRLPPVFHETAKFWACCSNQKCYSWDSFMQIPGCQVGPHTDVKPNQPSVLGGSDVRAGNDGSQPQEKVKTIDEFNAERRAVSSAPANAGEAIAKMYQTRQALEKGGVPGELYDQAKEKLMEKFGGDHQAVAQELNARFVALLEDISK